MQLGHLSSRLEDHGGGEAMDVEEEGEGISPREELLRLAIHGTLHVLGYDHPEAAEERKGSEMYQHQEQLLRTLLTE